MVRQPQIDDAKNFLERVKDAFRNQRGVYDKFVEIMKNFKHDKYVPVVVSLPSMSIVALICLTLTRCHLLCLFRLNTGGVIQEVQDLFDGHEELFVGFQNFLPATVQHLFLSPSPLLSPFRFPFSLCYLRSLSLRDCKVNVRVAMWIRAW